MVYTCFLGLHYHMLLLLLPFLIRCCFIKHAVRQFVHSHLITCHDKQMLSGNHIMEVLFNKDSEDNLTPESDSDESCDSEMSESPEDLEHVKEW